MHGDWRTQTKLLVIAAMSNDKDEEILELSDTLSAKLLQNAEFIETAYDCLKTYKQQSMAWVDITSLDASTISDKVCHM
jgi:hypothetical protein